MTVGGDEAEEVKAARAEAAAAAEAAPKPAKKGGQKRERASKAKPGTVSLFRRVLLPRGCTVPDVVCSCVLLKQRLHGLEQLSRRARAVPKLVLYDTGTAFLCTQMTTPTAQVCAPSSSLSCCVLLTVDS